MTLIQSWCQNNLDIIFFIYGLAFLVMGITILLQPKSNSRFEIASILWILAIFAIAHGLNEFLNMWGMVKSYSLNLDIIRWPSLIISYLFLFEFGSRLIRLAEKNSSKLRRKTVEMLTGWIAPFVCLAIIATFISLESFWNVGSILIRYLFVFPAGLFIGLGLKFYYHNLKDTLEPLKVKKYFFLVGYSFFVYGILGGLIVPKADFFPANWLNHETFLSVVGLPIQLFRATCAVIGTIGTFGMLKIFNWEVTKKLQDAFMVREKITESIDEAIILINNDFRVVWANKKAKAIYGDLVGECYYYDYATHYVLSKEDSSAKEPINACPIVEALTEDSVKTMLHTYTDEKGKANYVEVSAYPVSDEQNNTIEFVHVARDVTERIRAEEFLKKAYAELKQTQQELIQSEKLAALGRFSLGLAHEVKNPLAIILSGVEYLELKCQCADHDIQRATEVIKDAVFRADETIKRLLKFSRPESLKIEKINPVDLVNEAVSLFKYTAPLVNIEIKTEFSPEQILVEVDKGQIQQVLFNLVMNSIDAMHKGGIIMIKVYKRNPPEFPEAKCIIKVIDTGEGISKENLSKIFEPFFTTKRDTRGTGLGLSISRAIINDHKGELSLTSEVNVGTTVKIVLPLA